MKNFKNFFESEKNKQSTEKKGIIKIFIWNDFGIFSHKDEYLIYVTNGDLQTYVSEIISAARLRGGALPLLVK